MQQTSTTDCPASVHGAWERIWLWAEHHGLQQRAPCPYVAGVAMLLATLTSPGWLASPSPALQPQVPAQCAEGGWHAAGAVRPPSVVLPQGEWEGMGGGGCTPPARATPWGMRRQAACKCSATHPPAAAPTLPPGVQPPHRLPFLTTAWPGPQCACADGPKQPPLRSGLCSAQ